MNKYVRVNTRERYDERLRNVFSDFICSEADRIDGHRLLSCHSFHILL